MSLLYIIHNFGYTTRNKLAEKRDSATGLYISVPAIMMSFCIHSIFTNCRCQHLQM